VALVAYYFAICALGHTLYYTVLVSRTGQTWGKALLRVRVEMPDGSIPSFGVALGRALSFDLCFLGTVRSSVWPILSSWPSGPTSVRCTISWRVRW